MNKKFDIVLLEEAKSFLGSLEKKEQKKVIINLNKATYAKDSSLFKKLKGNIWEFRTLYNGKSFRIFAFWDKRSKEDTLVITTHGILKKTQKTPSKEIAKAEKIRTQYFSTP